MQLPFLNQSNPNDNPSTTGGGFIDALDKPETRAMLLQTGLALLSGGGGGNVGQQLAYSLSHGLEAKDRVIGGQQEQEAAAAEQARKDAQLGLEREQLQATVANQQANRTQDASQFSQSLAVQKQNADTARISATRTTPSTTDDRVNRTAWLKFVTAALENASFNQETEPTIEELAAEWTRLGGVLPSSISAPSPTTQAAATVPPPKGKVPWKVIE